MTPNVLIAVTYIVVPFSTDFLLKHIVVLHIVVPFTTGIVVKHVVVTNIVVTLRAHIVVILKTPIILFKV